MKCECEHKMCAGHEVSKCNNTALVNRNKKLLCMGCAILNREYNIKFRFHFENFWKTREPGISLNFFTFYWFTGCCETIGITILNFNFEWIKDEE